MVKKYKNRADLIWDVEMKLAMDCEAKNVERRAKGIPEKCDCPLPEKMTDEELYAILGDEKNEIEPTDN